MRFPGGLDGKESACNAGDPGLILGSGGSPGGEHGKTHQYPCLENLMDRGAWWAIVHKVAQSQTQLKLLSTHACTERSRKDIKRLNKEGIPWQSIS